MTYTIERIQDEDFAYIVPRMFSTFGNSYEFVNSLYPNYSTPAGHKKIAGKFQSTKNAAANATWTKAIDAVSTKAVDLAVWTLIEETKPPETELDGPPGTWPSKADKEYFSGVASGSCVRS
ncbi:hypothetical protein K458DRAFT_391797 [Lentithecium fluviatile CBS 122367]|uniref:Uncharacterized protein n=1 Tax=Lentithecium fluviatile CBS 122367 TaxID=1168545 RepID=A0A6G1ITI1_9PLEO|nr:hypothetical protein K458DRAFT_391797 [Lentithecium fluviatile CBS 122367]